MINLKEMQISLCGEENLITCHSDVKIDLGEQQKRRMYKDKQDKRNRQESVLTIVPSDHYQLKSSLPETRRVDL